MSELSYDERPSLDRPILIMGFGGWPNAGEVSTGTMDYLLSRLETRPLASIDPDRFCDYTTDRPLAAVSAGKLEQISLPQYRFSYVPRPEGERDLILFSGREPNLRWNVFCDLILKLAEEMEVESLITIGGTYDYVPHWLDPQISVVFSEDSAKDLLGEVIGDLSPAEYSGPVSVHSTIMLKARQHHLPVIGLWGHAPIYIQTGNIKIHYFILRVLKRTVGLSLDTSDLLTGIAEMETQIEQLVAKNPRLKKYLDELKEEYKGEPFARRPGPAMSGADAPNKGKVISIDAFFKREDD